MTLVLSTRNPGKLREFEALLAPTGCIIRSLDAFPGAPDVDENCDTLDGNAAKKAEIIMEFTGYPTLADDTGLEVHALDGAPGVWSARWAGPECTPADNRKKLLSALQEIPDRRARFRTVIALATPDGTTFHEGVCDGQITIREQGNLGFGYDALFRPDGHEKTFAQMDAPVKNAISHRGRALQALLSALETNPELRSQIT
ncbi:MAG: non-canonical purine NTP pyrophosphatase, RdgB/HAM1 family [Bacteroidetes bacterium CG12_big_fil_rev_8_21_14_0_65_60_17]|nr:MAG: non-canonical purine NTP pyrophosphatase, RdgB/HAM1 family [Bacteroidetes bacterium CG12_big_fil_rev_8_21_14_0_65_60_17]